MSNSVVIVKYCNKLGIVSALLAVMMSINTAFAADFTCILEIQKSNCWPAIDLQVNMIDNNTREVVNTYQLPKNTHYLKKTFDCGIAKTIGFIASFDPPVWPKDQGKQYHTQQLYTIPTALSKGANQWILRLCFDNDFASVPLPTSGDVANCRCQFPEMSN